MLFSTALFPSMICGTAFLINFVAIYYRASRAIPFTSMVSCMFTVLAFLLIEDSTVCVKTKPRKNFSGRHVNYHVL